MIISKPADVTQRNKITTVLVSLFIISTIAVLAHKEHQWQTYASDHGCVMDMRKIGDIYPAKLISHDPESQLGLPDPEIYTTPDQTAYVCQDGSRHIRF